MNANTRLKLCNYIIRIAGILFWYNILIMIFNNSVSKDRVLVSVFTLIVGYMELKVKNYLVSKN